MEDKKLEEEIQKLVDGYFTVKSIMNINHDPHPFMLGPKHIRFASNKYMGMLGDACINDKDFPVCAHSGCSLRYQDHKSDRVLALSLVKDLTNAEANNILKTIPLIKNKIDGIIFVDTPEKFRIL
jgi:hypothetical protein